MKKSKVATGVVAVCLIISLMISSGFTFALQREVLLQSQSTGGSTVELPFTDIKGHWAEAGIMEMYARGVVSGYQDSTFGPNKSITHMEAIIAIDKLLGYEPLEEDKESWRYLGDLFEIPEWAQGYVAVALKNDLLRYDELENISRQQPLLRQDAATLAIRALKLSRQVRNAKDIKISFSDMEKVDSNVKAIVSLVCEMKIMTGFTDGTFRPSSPVSRAEMAMLLSRIVQQRPRAGDISGRIKSVDSKNKIITFINNEGSEIRMDLPEALFIYVNNRPATVDQLVEGNYLRIINKNSKLTVFVSSSLRPDEGTPVHMKIINASAVPEYLRQWVDSNKALPNYLFKVYDGKIYFLAARGEKMTGGYTIDITGVTSLTDTDAKINYFVTVIESDPDETSIVNQVISYPYSLVEISLPKTPRGTVTFINQNNVVLAEIKF